MTLLSQSLQLPTIIPPSPTAQNFMRYGEIPVNYCTGVPNIEIPLYTVETRKLKLPISISYHASGIKVEDIASEVGLGWVLNCGGIVSRTVQEQADEEHQEAKMYTNANQLLNTVNTKAWEYNNSCNCYLGIDNMEVYLNSFNAGDPLSDRFFYQLPNGISGVFRLGYGNQNNIIKLPYRPLKIEKSVNNSGSWPRIENIKITDEEGTKYTFTSFSTKRNATEWYLTTITSADGTDSIQLNYTYNQQNQAYHHTGYALTSHTQDISESCLPNTSTIPTTSISQSLSQTVSFDVPLLQSITSSTAHVSFNYRTNRLDFNQLSILSDINIAPANNPTQIIKSIHFNQMYFGSDNNTYRLGLSDVTINTSTNTTGQKYEFGYESQTLPPYPHKASCYSVDFWGYYNGSNSPGLIPFDFISSSSDKNAFGANREADDGTYSRACMIKSIKYPTGGRSVFQFDRNYASNVYQYKPNNQAGYVGGFRIGNIVNYNEKNEIVDTKNYEYNNALIRPINKIFFTFDMYGCRHNTYVDREGWSTDCWIQSTDGITLSDPVLPLEVASGLAVMYTSVTEYKGTKTSNSGKTVYQYNLPYSPSNFESNSEHPSNWEEPRFYSATHYDKGNFTPELQSKTEYSFDGAIYHPVSKIVNQYTTLNASQYLTGIKLTRTKNFPSVVGNGYGSSFVTDYIQSIVAIDTKAYQEASLVSKTENYLYNPTDATKYVLSTTDIEYDPTYLQMTKQTTTTSISGKNKVTQFTYPFNYNNEPYITMLQMNNISPVIEKHVTCGVGYTESTRTNYINRGNNVIVPASFDMKTGSNTYETRLVYDTHDSKGNPQSLIKDGINKVVYLWGYNQTYPVAKIEGATLTEVSTALGGIPNLGAEGLNSAQIASLRSQLPNALVSTYTYKPLIGMTTVTDPKGVTTNYAYDTFNRLYLTRNDDKNIVAKYRYAYQNNPDNGMGGYATLTGAVTVGTSSYSLGSSGSASISASGGSGNFSYSWSLLYGSTVLATGGNSNSFNFTCNQTGTLTVKCIVTDNNTGQTKPFTQDITCSGATITYGNFTFVSGYTNYYNSLSNNGTTVSFILSFGVNSTAMDPGTSYFVAWLPDGFKPSVNRSVMLDSYGATWEVIFTPYGTVYCKIVSGSSIPVGGGASLSGNYNL
jgi:hypothetical protein